MKWLKESKITIFLVSLLVLTGLTGCSLFSREVILHPVDKRDIAEMKKGMPYTPEQDGWFLSDFYLEEIVRAKVGK